MSDESDFESVKEVLSTLDGSLSSQPFLVGETLTIADLATVANLSLLELVYYEVKQWKNVWAWLHRVKHLPYYAACNKGLESWKLALYVRDQDRLERKKRLERKNESEVIT